MPGQVQIAKEHWGPDIPDWVLQLAQECELAPQTKVARKLKIAPSAVSQVLRKKYGADPSNIEAAVRGIYMDTEVDCPALGTLRSHICRDWRRKAETFAPTNANRVRMFKACNNCPKFTGV